MKFLLLLDSNILIPMLDGSGRELPKVIVDLLHNPDAELWASVASIWEVAIKHRQGKLPLPCALEDWPDAFAQLNIRALRIMTAHVVAPVEPLPDTKDPFDRLLLAICRVERMKLVTLDSKLRDHSLAWRP